MSINSKFWVPNKSKWLCLWMDENDMVVVNEDREYLCAESPFKGNKETEKKMSQAAKYYGIEGGRPYWIPGRKISKDEWDEQMARLQAGEIPDPEENADEWVSGNE